MFRHSRKAFALIILLLASLSLALQFYQAYEQKVAIQRMSEQGFGAPCDLGSFLYSPIRMMVEVFAIILFVGTLFRRIVGALLSSVGLLGAGCIYVLWWQEYFRQRQFVESEISLRLLREASPAYLYGGNYLDPCVAVLLLLLIVFYVIWALRFVLRIRTIRA
jgi:hypothetical protein